MVNAVKKSQLLQPEIELVEIPIDDIKWTEISLSDVIGRGLRLEASTFNLDREHALRKLEHSRYEVVKLSEEGGLIDCFYGPRSKRRYLSKTDSTSIGFLGSSEMLDINPKPVKFVAPDNPMIKKLRLEYGMILISRSGTIGNVTFVNKTLQKYLVSEHAIRLIVNDYPDFVYAYLKTDVAQNLLHSEKFGSVILEIEPESFVNMPIPNPPNEVKDKIHNLILSSYNKRDKSNELIDQATQILVDELELPSLEKLRKEAFSYSREINSFDIKLSSLDGRLEASYHVPIIQTIEKHIAQKVELIKLNDERITKKIILPGRFKRVYVEKGNGKVFLGGKEIGQLDPANKKYLSLTHHSERIRNELTLKKDMILVTCSGTIGKVSIVPQHWESWTVNQHVLRVVSKKPFYGLIYTWLNSEYGKALISRQIYGSVVDEITDKQIGEVSVPILKNEQISDDITELINKANDLRYRAYQQEQEAIAIMNEEVLGL